MKAIQLESTHTVDIDGFVPRADIDKRYLDKPYYIAPNGKAGAEAFVVIRDAMQDEERVALARRVHVEPFQVPEDRLEDAAELVEDAFKISQNPVDERDLILEVVS